MKGTQKKKFVRTASETFMEYCSHSSIHGVRYFADQKRTRCEKFWWMLVFLVSMVGCGILIGKAYRKWELTPVIVTFSERYTPVSDIQFPAVTICPETKVSSAIMNFTAEMLAATDFVQRGLHHSLSYDPEVVDRLKAVAQLCNELFHSDDDTLLALNGTDEGKIVEVLRAVSLPEYNVIPSCTFPSEQSCESFIQNCITEEGVCFTFNALTQEQMFHLRPLQTEYRYLETPNWITNYTLPTGTLKVNAAGMSSGLSIYLKQEASDLDYKCKGLTQGYRVILHEADEYPRISKRSIRVPLGQEVTVAVKPQISTTSTSLESYSWQKRQCFFDHEHVLKFFHHYSQDNCELECLTNYTFHHCGCVLFSMPREGSTRVCPLSKWHCMEDAKSRILQQNSLATCNCLPSCSSVQYDTEITQATLEWENYVKVNEMPLDARIAKFSRLNVYFKESQFITSKRTELYGVVDFLANCGGLLGLFMGVSFLSIVEMAYFVAIRPYHLFKAKKQRRATKVFKI